MFVFLFLKTGITFTILGRKDSQDKTLACQWDRTATRPTTAAAFRAGRGSRPTQGSSSPHQPNTQTQRARRDPGPLSTSGPHHQARRRTPPPCAAPTCTARQPRLTGPTRRRRRNPRAPGARTPPRFPGEGHELLITRANGRSHPPFPSPRRPPCLAPSRNSSATTLRVALP
jgi:hypothetical protein